MTETSVSAISDAIGGDRRQMRRRAARALVALLLVAIVAVLGIVWFADSERDRLTAEWEIRLGLVADSRKAAVEDWLNERRGEVLRLAANRTVQFHLVDLADPELAREETDSSRLYIEGLMTSEAERGGYLSPRGQVATAGHDTSAQGGLILLDASNNIVAQTPGAPDPTSLLPDSLRPGQVGFRPVRGG